MADNGNQKGGKGKGAKPKSQDKPAQPKEKSTEKQQAPKTQQPKPQEKEVVAKPEEVVAKQEIETPAAPTVTRAEVKPKAPKKEKKEEIKEPGKGTVKAVLSGDTIVVLNLSKTHRGPPPERIISLSNLKAPSMERKKGGEIVEKDQPWAFDSREYLRKLCIGKVVNFVVEHKNPSGREYGVVFLPSKENVGKMVVSEGWAEVKSPKNITWPELEELQQAEEKAKKEGLGMWSKKEGTVRSSSSTPTTTLFEKYKGKPLTGVVESVLNGSTLRLTLFPSLEEVLITLSGVSCPSAKNKEPEPFGLEAKFFTEIHLLNRDVQVVLEGADKTNLVGTLIYNNKYVSEELLQEGLGTYVEWSAQRTGKFAERLKAAENKAKEKKLRLFSGAEAPKASSRQDEKKKLVPGKETLGKVIEIANGGSVIVVDGKSVEHKVYLSSISQSKFKKEDKKDRLIDELEKSVKYEAKEYLRKRLIGQKVRCVFDYERTKKDSTEENNYYSIYVGKNNVAVELVERGLAVPSEHRGGDLRSRDYELMLFADKRASAAGKGIHAKAEKAATVKMLDVRDPKAAKQIFGILQRAGRLKGVVEYEFSASRLKLIVPKETCQIVLSLSGIQTSREKEIAAEALFFIKEKVHQHDVEFEVVGQDKAAGFVGHVWVNKENLATLLLEKGYAKIFRTADKSAEFALAEDIAKKARRGIWKDYDEAAEKAERREREEKKQAANQEVLEILVTEILDGGHFYAQIIDSVNTKEEKKALQEGEVAPTTKKGAHYKENIEKLEALMKQLGIDAEGNGYKPIQGELVRAQFTEDDAWYRAKVVSIEEDEKCKVLYIDYGNSEVIPISRIRKLSDEHKQLPPQAVEAELAYLKIRPIDQEYGPETADAFRDLVWSKTLLASVESREGDKLILDLTERNGTLSVNASLVAMGLARIDRFKGRKNQSAINQLRDEEREARANHYGIWEYGDPGSDDEGDDKRPRRI